VRITDQEAWTERGRELRLSDLFKEIIEEISFAARESQYVDQSSGVSARLSIAARENLVSNLERRAVLSGEEVVYPRICDLYAMLPSMTGKLELVYEGEREGNATVALQLIGEGVKRAFRRHFVDFFRQRDEGDWSPRDDSPLYRAVSDHFRDEQTVELADDMPYGEYLDALTRVPGLRAAVDQQWPAADPREVGGLMEFVLEGLHQHSILSKTSLTRAVRYQDMLVTMFRGFE